MAETATLEDPEIEANEGDSNSEMQKKIGLAIALMLGLLIFSLLLSVFSRGGNNNSEPAQQQVVEQPAAPPVETVGRTFEDELDTARRLSAQKKAREQDEARRNAYNLYNDQPLPEARVLAGLPNDGPSQYEAELNAARQALATRSQLVIASPQRQDAAVEPIPPFSHPSQQELAQERERLGSNVDALRERLKALKAEQGAQ